MEVLDFSLQEENAGVPFKIWHEDFLKRTLITQEIRPTTNKWKLMTLTTSAQQQNPSDE